MAIDPLKKVNPFEGAIKRRIKARQEQFKQGQPDKKTQSDEMNNEEPDITKRRKRIGY